MILYYEWHKKYNIVMIGIGTLDDRWYALLGYSTNEY